MLQVIAILDVSICKLGVVRVTTTHEAIRSLKTTEVLSLIGKVSDVRVSMRFSIP